MKSAHSLYAAATICLSFMVMAAGCSSAHKQAGGSAATSGSDTLPLQRIEQGEIATAMQWKKAAVFTPWAGDSGYLLEFLRGLDERGLAEGETATLPVDEIPAIGAVHLYLLYGWSTSGADALRSVTLDSAAAAGNRLEVYVTRPEIEYDETPMGTADMKFIGWDIEAGRLSAGEYTAELYVKQIRIQVQARPYKKEIVSEGEYQLQKSVKFTIVGGD